MQDVFGLHSWSPAELQEQLAASRDASPVLAYRSATGEQLLLSLGDDRARVAIGREEGCDVCLDADEEVSRLHAELERVGPDWAIADNGLSRNGSYVNGQRVLGRRRLHDGDTIRVGGTLLLYRSGTGRRRIMETRPARQTSATATISPTQRRILIALCRPFKHGGSFATAPANQVIADEVCLSVHRVKAHLRALFDVFEVGPLPHNQKRVRLAELALQTGLISRDEL